MSRGTWVDPLPPMCHLVIQSPLYCHILFHIIAYFISRWLKRQFDIWTIRITRPKCANLEQNSSNSLTFELVVVPPFRSRMERNEVSDVREWECHVLIDWCVRGRTVTSNKGSSYSGNTEQGKCWLTNGYPFFLFLIDC